MTSSTQAFETWNLKQSVRELEGRIHDGVAIGDLRARANGYIDVFCRLFPELNRIPAGGVAVEVGSGLGYIMEAAAHRFSPNKVLGLDVAENMISSAKERLARDGADLGRFDFVHYDGIDVPLADNSVDLVFSCATIQHIPKAFAYHLFSEIKRILKPGGYAALHMLSFKHLAEHNKLFPVLKEARDQQQGKVRHWHFFYSYEELYYLLSEIVGVTSLDLKEQVPAQTEINSIYVCFSKGTGKKFSDAELPAAIRTVDGVRNLVVKSQELEETLRAAEETRHATEETLRATEETLRAAEETLRAAEETLHATEETLRATEERSAHLEGELRKISSSRGWRLLGLANQLLRRGR